MSRQHITARLIGYAVECIAAVALVSVIVSSQVPL